MIKDFNTLSYKFSSYKIFVTKQKFCRFCPIFTWLFCEHIGKNFRHQVEFLSILLDEFLSDKVIIRLHNFRTPSLESLFITISSLKSKAWHSKGWTPSTSNKPSKNSLPRRCFRTRNHPWKRGASTTPAWWIYETTCVVHRYSLVLMDLNLPFCESSPFFNM